MWLGWVPFYEIRFASFWVGYPGVVVLVWVLFLLDCFQVILYACSFHAPGFRALTRFGVPGERVIHEDGRFTSNCHDVY